MSGFLLMVLPDFSMTYSWKSNSFRRIDSI